jgi:hypothetical protein
MYDVPTIKIIKQVVKYFDCVHTTHYKKQNKAMHQKNSKQYRLFQMHHFILLLVIYDAPTIKIIKQVVKYFDCVRTTHYKK